MKTDRNTKASFKINTSSNLINNKSEKWNINDKLMCELQNFYTQRTNKNFKIRTKGYFRYAKDNSRFADHAIKKGMK